MMVSRGRLVEELREPGLGLAKLPILAVLEVAESEPEPHDVHPPVRRNDDHHGRMLGASGNRLPEARLRLIEAPRPRSIEHYRAMSPARQPAGLDVLLPMWAVGVDDHHVLPRITIRGAERGDRALPSAQIPPSD